ncbi:MMPL family transporter [Bacteroidales bacterium AH-315-I05]|nr:MMPL family transporter [Bacteroidales bacterium AH-315-I05]
MWAYFARRILRNRILLLSLLGLATAFMGWQATTLKVSYGVPRLLPDNDSTYIAYQKFKERYGREGIVYVIGIHKDPLNDLALFNAWRSLGEKINAIEGVDTLVSVANNIFYIEKDTENKQFNIRPVVTSALANEQELDSIKKHVKSLKFFEGRLYNKETGANLMFATLDSSLFNSSKRSKVVMPLLDEIANFEKEQGMKVYVSGMAYVRTVMREMIKNEMIYFVFLALLVTVIILYLFFRTLPPVLASLIVVIIGVIWSLGSLPILGYELGILTGIVPALVIVIGVPNCVYLINKYHSEYRKHGNQALALSRMIEKIGSATMLTNATTAIGFITFIFTQSEVLKEFGVVASLNIMAIFFISLFTLPVIFSYMKPPAEKTTKHLDKVWLTGVLSLFVKGVTNGRRWVYLSVILLVLAGFLGVTLIETTGNMVDDLPKGHRVLHDLKFVEENFDGIMPFEISIDGKKPNSITKISTLKKIDELQDMISAYPEFSSAISIAEGIKFMKQGFYNGNPKKYQLLNNSEKAFFKPYIKNRKDKENLFKAYIDSNKQNTRVSFFMADIGTRKMDTLLTELKPRIDSIFPSAKYNVSMTGSSIVFLKGTTYLIKNLLISLGIAIGLVAIIMALFFAVWRMVLISMATNLFPLLLTAGAMGYLDIHLKPSTIIVFSIAFGISVDYTIHFLAKYRQELKASGWDIRHSVYAALNETGVSMIYTSIILFFGFSIFMTSDFGGTKALGMLVSLTLFLSLLSNLLFLPSMLLSLERALTTKAFKEPLIEVFDEEEDIDHERLKIGKDNGANIEKQETEEKRNT